MKRINILLIISLVLFLNCAGEKPVYEKQLDALEWADYEVLGEVEFNYRGYPIVGAKDGDRYYVYLNGTHHAFILSGPGLKNQKRITSVFDSGPKSIKHLRTCEIIDGTLWIQDATKGLQFDLDGNLMKEIRISVSGYMYNQFLPLNSKLVGFLGTISRGNVNMTPKDGIFLADKNQKITKLVKSVKNPSYLQNIIAESGQRIRKHDFCMQLSVVRVDSLHIWINKVYGNGVEQYNLVGEKISEIILDTLKIPLNQKTVEIINDMKKRGEKMGTGIEVLFNEYYPLNCTFFVDEKYIYVLSFKIYQSPYFYILSIFNKKGALIKQVKMKAADGEDYYGIFDTFQSSSFCFKNGYLYLFVEKNDSIYELRNYELLETDKKGCFRNL